MSVKIIGSNIPNLPWQDRPASASLNSPIWRYSENPIIGRNPVKDVARIFNSAVLPHDGKFIGVFRGDGTDSVQRLYLGESIDGIKWDFRPEPIQFVDEKGEPFQPLYSYDPRLLHIEGVWYVMWCQDFFGASIGMAKTTDMKTFTRLENPFIPFNRNAVLFPRKINGAFKMLSRPSDNAHTPFGDIFISESKDLEYWGRHRHVMSTKSGWEALKIGGSAPPIETSEGWLCFYHGVELTCSGYVYAVGGAILDIDEPSKVLYRCKNYLMRPETPYEEMGMVPNVVFPVAALADAATGRIAIYYGAADSYVGLAFTTVDETVKFIKDNSKLSEEDAGIGRR